MDEILDDIVGLFRMSRDHCSTGALRAPRRQEDSSCRFIDALRRFGSLFCCPPTRNAIIRKLAFQPPAPPTYTLEEDCTRSSGRRFQMITTDSLLPGRVLSGVRGGEVFTVRKEDGSQVALFRLTFEPGGRTPYTVFFSHGNATDLGRCLPFIEFCVRELCCDFVAYDYSGYGASAGAPSEDNMLHDAETVLKFAVSGLGIPVESIVLFGESIGSVPSLHLATRENVRGLILQGALASAAKMLFPSLEANIFGLDFLRNIERIPAVRCRVLFIHGTRDEVVDIEHAKQLISRCPTAVEPLWVAGAGHGECPKDPHWTARVSHFIETLQ